MIHFSTDRYNKIRQDFELWWEHKLDRPIIQVTLTNMSKALTGDFFGSNYRKEILEASYDMEISVEEAVKRIDDAYSSVEFYGDAFPVFYMRPTGVLGGYLGQESHINRNLGTVWFHNEKKSLKEALALSLDRSCDLYKRSIGLTRQVQEHFDGKVAVGVPDLGGVYDILASICDSNDLLLDLCIEEEAVKKAAWNIHEQFKLAYEDFLGAIDPGKIPGYTCWATMLSQKPYFVLQNDFSAMISADMFDDFYMPILEKECRHIPRTIYHLDGPGAVRHLDSILTIPELDGVQWINGAGAPGLDQWPDIYRKIRSAGKLCQVFINGAEELRYIDDVIELFGGAEGLCFICSGDSAEREKFDAYLVKYGVIQS